MVVAHFGDKDEVNLWHNACWYKIGIGAIHRG